MNKGLVLLISVGLLLCACNERDKKSPLKKKPENIHIYKDTAFLKDGLFATFQLDFSGNRQGAAYLFDQKDRMIGQGYYENNVRTGTYILYGSNGKVKAINNYKNDRLNGYHVSYTDLGEPTCSGFFNNDKKDGKWVCYDTITRTISEIRHFANDNCVGSEFFFNKEGAITKLVFRNFDGIIGTVNFDEIGKPEVKNKLNTLFYDGNIHIGKQSNATILLPHIPGFFVECECKNAENETPVKLNKEEELGCFKYSFNYQFHSIGIYRYVCATRIYNDKMTLFQDEIEFSINVQ